MARDIQAVKFIQVWGARVGRLPAGVETTHSLLVAITPLPGHGREQVPEPRLPPGYEHVGADQAAQGWGQASLARVAGGAET